MPWNEENKMTLREAAIFEFFKGEFTKIEICQKYNISRPTLNKWIYRYMDSGYNGLRDQSSAPKTRQNTIDSRVIKIIDKMNSKKGWGAVKLKGYLELKHSHLPTPSKNGIQKYLERNGKVVKRRRKANHKHPGKPIVHAEKPNDIWPIDYKGERKSLDGKYFYPLTITDLNSHSLLGTFCHTGTFWEAAKTDMTRVFQEHGLPKAMLSDNGTPFSSRGINGISKLNIWWTELGIQHILTQPSSPQQNGAHERMHREMQRWIRLHPGKNLKHQQRLIDEFLYDYNNNLKHGGLDDASPAQIYTPSVRMFPNKILPPEYPHEFEVRKISKTGGFRWYNDLSLIHI